jgi:hypothetical protein
MLENKWVDFDLNKRILNVFVIYCKLFINIFMIKIIEYKNLTKLAK